MGRMGGGSGGGPCMNQQGGTPTTATAIDEAKAKVAQSPAGTIAVQGEIELLKIALELERQTSGFYRQLVDTLTLAERGLFARFLEIEQGHLLLVQAEIDALAGHGTWFDVMEFRLEAG